MSGRGFGSRYDKFTPNAIDQARGSPANPLVNYTPNFKTAFCFKCQKDKPREGSTKRMGMIFCAECK